MFTLTM